MSATNSQVDGDHYKVMGVQPIELAYYLGASPCFCKLAKYLTRDKGDRLVNLRKALHCIELEEELLGFTNPYAPEPEELTSLEEKKRNSLAWYWIKKFSPNKTVERILNSMYERDHGAAKLQVSLMIKHEEEVDVNG